MGMKSTKFLNNYNYSHESSETQGQLVARRQSRNGWEKFDEKRKKNKSPWGQTLYGQVPNSYFSFELLLVKFFPARFDFVFGPTNCPWVSKDELQ